MTTAASAVELCHRLELHDRFDRWRFLQHMLDEEVSAHDTQLVLLTTLLRQPPSQDELKEERIESVVQTLSTPTALADLLLLARPTTAHQEVETTKTTITNNNPNGTERLVLLHQLEQLLPDPMEDEDAFKSLWDLVIEIHGRESVKINERNGSIQWKARCLIARVLLHFDFLTDGFVVVVVDEEPI